MKNFILAFILGVTILGFDCDGLGNILGFDFPSYNVITENDDIDVANAKQLEQIKIVSESL